MVRIRQEAQDIKEFKGSYQSGQMGLTVTQLAYAFGGSNPSLPTQIAEVSAVEHFLGKEEVPSSSLGLGSDLRQKEIINQNKEQLSYGKREI